MANGPNLAFNRYFYKPQPMRTLEEIHADIMQVERETEGLMHDILGMGGGMADEVRSGPAATQGVRGGARGMQRGGL